MFLHLKLLKLLNRGWAPSPITVRPQIRDPHMQSRPPLRDAALFLLEFGEEQDGVDVFAQLTANYYNKTPSHRESRLVGSCRNRAANIREQPLATMRVATPERAANPHG